MRWASLGPTPLARGDHRLVAAATRPRPARPGSSTDRIASATRPPTPWTLVSCAEGLALAGRAEAEQGPAVLAHLQFGQDHDIAADRAERIQRPAARLHLIADALDIDHRVVGGGFGEHSGQAGDHGTKV